MSKVHTGFWNLFKVEGHSWEITRILFSPKGTHFVTSSVDTSCKVWSISTGELVQTFSGHDFDIINIEFNEKGDKLMSGSKDKNIIVWEYNLE